MLDPDSYYGDHDTRLGSPPLEAVHVLTTPPKSPPPILLPICRPSRIQSVSSPSSRIQKPNRRKTRPTQGDWVLILEMEPNRPDIAQQVSERALNSGSEAEDDSEEEMEAQSPNAFNDLSGPTTAQNLPVTSSTELQQTTVVSLFPSNDPKATSTHRDSVVEDDVKHGGLFDERRLSNPSVVNIVSNGVRSSLSGASLNAPGNPTLSNSSLNPPNQQHKAVSNGHSHDITSIISPQLRQLTIPQLGGPPTDRLPALQAPSPAHDGSAGSPGQQQSLPSFRHIDEMAKSSTSDQDMTRANGFPHRQSISSVGQSPTSIVRQLSISSHSPATPFPLLNASSPMSANSDMQRPDIFLRSAGAGGIFVADARRPSHATSETGAYHAALHSGSTSESYQSSEGPSPGAQQTPIEGRPRHMSLDGALTSRVLPPPVGSGIHVTAHGSGSFKCDYPNCNAAPFQTQYLLK